MAKQREKNSSKRAALARKTHNRIMIRQENLAHQFDDEPPLLEQGAKNDRLDAVGYAARFAAENIGQEPTPAKMLEAVPAAPASDNEEGFFARRAGEQERRRHAIPRCVKRSR